MLTRTRASDGSIIPPMLHVPPVQISTPYVPHPLQLLGQVHMHGVSPGSNPAAATVKLPSLSALALTNHHIPFTFNGFLPR